MTREEKIMILEARLARLNGRGEKNTKAPGVKKKVIRELRRIAAGR